MTTKNPTWLTVWKVWKFVGWVLLGVLFQALAVFLATEMLGGGHGDPFYLQVLIGPWWILHAEVWLWPVAGALFAVREFSWARYSLIGLLLFQYIGIMMIGPDERPNVVWTYGKLLVVTYVVVQLLVWSGIVRAAILDGKQRA